MHSPVLTKSRSRTAIAFLAILLFLSEFIFVTLRFQSQAFIDMPELVSWQRAFGYTGFFAKAVVLAILLYVFIRKQFVIALCHRLLAGFSPKRFGLFFCIQLPAYAVFLYFSQVVFHDTLKSHQMPVWAAIGWLLSGFLVFLLWLFSLATAAQLKRYFVHELGYWLLVIPITLAACLLSVVSQTGWGVLSEKAFWVAAWMLGLFGSDLLYVDAANQTLGLGNFLVLIAPQCSGYEGVGLITAFVALYLTMNRKELRFPLALILFPVGAVFIWFLNCARIALLVAMGYYWSPEVAVGGFHSQAGWITFILTSVSLLWVVDNSQLLRKSAVPIQVVQNPPSASHGAAIATLVPLVVLLATTLLTSAFSSGFDYIYGLRVVLVALALYKIWPQLNLPRFRPRWDGVLAAILVAVVWTWLLGTDADLNTNFQAQLDAMPGHWAWVWLAVRFIGAVITVPIAEELAFRAYLLCRLSKTEVHTSGPLPVSVIGIVVSSIAFGALHNAWLAGTFAGLVYAWVRLRSSHIGDAILAHAGTNAILFAIAICFGYWNLL